MSPQYIEYCRNIYTITDIDTYTRGYNFQASSSDNYEFYSYIASEDEWDIIFCDQYFGKMQGLENSYIQGRIDAYLDGKAIERPPFILSQDEFYLKQHLIEL